MFRAMRTVDGKPEEGGGRFARVAEGNLRNQRRSGTPRAVRLSALSASVPSPEGNYAEQGRAPRASGESDEWPIQAEAGRSRNCLHHEDVVDASRRHQPSA